ncbi:MAG: M20 family metallopeptidase [Pyramidobacter sp.]|nr:M20 family metallopeptidase [Pyramidobacter sp.]
MEREKLYAAVKASVESRRAGLCAMADQIFGWAELGLKEFKSSALLEDCLEREGFAVERGVGGLETAFRAVWSKGQGGPSFGLLCEYDALERLGHACGHHMQGPSIIGAALAIRDLAESAAPGAPFKIVVYGTPAEETLGGKTPMMGNGCFGDIDVALMMHGAPNTCVDVKSMASREFKIRFRGKNAHAALAPDQGRSAFDAALLSFSALEFLREHVREDTRIHYTVVDAGGPANVVPDHATAQYMIRSYDTDYLETLMPRVEDIWKGACLMTGTSYEIESQSRFWGKIPALALNDLIMEQARAFDAPQLAAPREKTGSTDFGIVMYKVPGCCIRCAFVPEGTSSHSQGFLDAGLTETAHSAVVFGAEILAAACLRILEEPALLEKIKADFTARKEGR